jgi:hypothetical protein
MENDLFAWFCHAQKNSTAVHGLMVEMTTDEIALKTSTDFKYSNGWLWQFRDDETLRDDQ